MFPSMTLEEVAAFFQMHKTQQNIRRYKHGLLRNKINLQKQTQKKRKGDLRITYQRIKNNRSSMIYKKYGQLNEFGKIMHEQHENINK